jgi:[acyl-carrier-protein] S-malonyltransferase
MEKSSRKRAYVAPGSGIKDWSYGLELARHWPKTDSVYDTVKRVTGVDVYDVCSRDLKNPETDPAITQPAALGIGYASADFLTHEHGPADLLGSLSAGEFTLVAIAGSVELAKALELAKKRGELQRDIAGGLGGSAMILLHKRFDKSLALKRQLSERIESLPDVDFANFHTPKKIGISFSNDAFDNGKLLEKFDDIPGVRRVLHNKEVVFRPHHPSLHRVQSALGRFMSKSVHVGDSKIPIMANYTGRAMQRGKTISKNLLWQTTAPTQTQRAMLAMMKRGVTEFIDIGPDNSMQKLLGDYQALFDVEVLSAVDILGQALQE